MDLKGFKSFDEKELVALADLKGRRSLVVLDKTRLCRGLQQQGFHLFLPRTTG